HFTRNADTAQLRYRTGIWFGSFHRCPNRFDCSEPKHGPAQAHPLHTRRAPSAFCDRFERFVMTSAVHQRLKIAIVAPSMAILGGQAVQAARLLDSWRGDPDIEAWLVPINPTPPAVLRRAAGVKFVRTAITQLSYWPSLLAQLRHADIVHVFSASYWSFLLAPLPAVVVARVFGKPVVMNYRSGEAPDHLKRSAIARAVLRHVDRNVVPSAFLRDVFDGF